MILLGCLCAMTAAVAQEQEAEPTPVEKLEQRTSALESSVKILQKLKVSGYIQGQYQYGDKDVLLMSVGTSNENPYDKGMSRIGIRRGRIKFAYEEGIASGVFQLDITEKGVGIKDAYLMVKDPWWKTISLKGGVFDRPFGYEISYSSSRRESPERSTVFRLLFPGERDLGGMLTLQAPKTSPWNILKLEGGLFAGNGINRETDNRLDFIGHLSANKTIGSGMKFGLGASYYNGNVYQGNKYVYTMNGTSFVVDSSATNAGGFAKRKYVGFDGQFSIMTDALGLTQLNAEYLFGTQPSGKLLTESPNTSALAFFGRDTYIRNFNGGYVMFTQDIGKLPFTAVLKYDWYDPNTNVSGDEVGQGGTGVADLFQQTFGFGAFWRANKNIRLTAYYEINGYEKTGNVKVNNTLASDLKLNVFTLRLQYKF